MKKKIIEAHMAVAFVYANLSYCQRRQVGAIIVKNDSVIAFGYNGTEPGEENNCEDEHGNSKPGVIHAEDNSLRKLTRSSESAENAVMFITDAPCKPCATRIADAGITKVYYARSYRHTDGLEYLKKRHVKIEQVKI